MEKVAELILLVKGLFLQIKESIEEYGEETERAQQILIPILTKFKEIIGHYDSNKSDIVHILPDQKKVLLFHVQRMVNEAKDISSGTFFQDKKQREINFLYSMHSFAELFKDWLGDKMFAPISQVFLEVTEAKKDCFGQLQSNLNLKTSESFSSTETATLISPTTPTTPATAINTSSSSLLSNQLIDSTTSSTLSSSSTASNMSSSALSSSSTASNMSSSTLSSNVNVSTSSIISSPTSPTSPSTLVSPSRDSKNDYSSFLNRNEPKNDSVLEEVQKKPYYHYGTLKKWGAKYFARARVDFEPGEEHGQLALSFKKGDLIAVFEDEGDIWQGANPEIEKFGYFPKRFVEVVKESTKLKEKEEQPKKELPKSTIENTQKPLSPEEIEAIKARRRITAPKPAISGIYQVKTKKSGKWQDCDVILGQETLFYSPVAKEKQDELDRKLVTLKLSGCQVQLPTEEEAGKGYVDKSVKVVDSKSDYHYFRVNNKEERSLWIKSLSLSSLSLKEEDLRLPKQYDYGSVSSRKFLAEGFDHKGNTFKMKEKEKHKSSGFGDVGSLTPEEIQKYSHMIPNKSVIDRMTQDKKSKRRSIFKTFK